MLNYFVVCIYHVYNLMTNTRLQRERKGGGETEINIFMWICVRKKKSLMRERVCAYVWERERSKRSLYYYNLNNFK